MTGVSCVWLVCGLCESHEPNQIVNSVSSVPTAVGRPAPAGAGLGLASPDAVYIGARRLGSMFESQSGTGGPELPLYPGTSCVPPRPRRGIASRLALGSWVSILDLRWIITTVYIYAALVN